MRHSLGSYNYPISRDGLNLSASSQMDILLLYQSSDKVKMQFFTVNMIYLHFAIDRHRRPPIQPLVDEPIEIMWLIRAEEFGNKVRFATALKTQVFEKAVDILWSTSATVLPSGTV